MMPSLKRALARGRITRVFNRLSGSRLRVLAYHGVPDPAAFAAQVDALLDDYRPLSLAELEEVLASGGTPPPRSLLVTFDDGDRSVYDHAFPILRDSGLPAALYVVTALLDTSTPFWWESALRAFNSGARTTRVGAQDAAELVRMLKGVPDGERRATLAELQSDVTIDPQPQLTSAEVRELADGGIAIGNHTATHPCLDRCDSRTIRSEIETAHASLEGLLGAPPTSFSYPNGNLDPEAERVLKALEYRSVFVFDHRLQAFPADPLRLSRIRVDSSADVDTFRLMASGAHPFIHHTVMRRR